MAQCTGTEAYHRSALGLVHTDGVKIMAEMCEAWWLVDAIASYQPKLMRHERLQQFQFWKLTLDGKGGAVLECRQDSDEPCDVSQLIPFTDFPLPEGIELWVESGILILPSEH